MAKNTKIQLSSVVATYGLYGTLLIMIFAAGKFIIGMFGAPFALANLLGPIIMLALVGYLLYYSLKAAQAQIVGNKLEVKKFLQPNKSYDFDRIGKIKVAGMGKAIYTTVELKNDDNTVESFVILNLKSTAFQDYLNVEKALTGRRDHALAPPQRTSASPN